MLLFKKSSFLPKRKIVLNWWRIWIWNFRVYQRIELYCLWIDTFAKKSPELKHVLFFVENIPFDVVFIWSCKDKKLLSVIYGNGVFPKIFEIGQLWEELGISLSKYIFQNARSFGRSSSSTDFRFLNLAESRKCVRRQHHVCLICCLMLYFGIY